MSRAHLARAQPSQLCFLVAIPNPTRLVSPRLADNAFLCHFQVPSRVAALPCQRPLVVAIRNRLGQTGGQKNFLTSEGVPIMTSKTGGDVFDKAAAEKFLYPANGLPGGGQLEVRMEISPDHPDP